MLAKNVNDNAFIQNQRGAHEFFASKLAPTHTHWFVSNRGCKGLDLCLAPFATGQQ
ncbi:hypothetical protein C4J87_0868 [Pseudomonas sp. R1-43-08]|nr:hypothetical protein C4J87_0868 [Pseudomonas sp. R1-43-08]